MSDLRAAVNATRFDFDWAGRSAMASRTAKAANRPEMRCMVSLQDRIRLLRRWFSARGVNPMRRREFIRLFSSTVVAWPLTARAQQPPGKMRRLGVLLPGAPPDRLVEAMQGRLGELGYSEGRGVAFEFRWAEGKLERLTQLATELADLKVD